MKLRSLLIVLLAFFAAGSFAQAPEGWFLDVVNPGDVELMPNTDNFTEGTQSCELHLLAPEVPYLVSNNFAVNAGDSYTFSIDVYDNDPNGYLKLYADFYDANGDDIYGEDPIEVLDDMDQWQTITWSATVPDGAVEGYILIKFYDGENYVDLATALIDNCMFDVDGTNLVENGGFETWGGVDMVKAYCASESMVYVVFDGEIPTTNPADFQLTGTADVTFASATMAPDMDNVLELSEPSVNLEPDMVLDKLTYAGTGTEFEFYAGVLPVAYVNENNPDGHIENDYLATFNGIIQANDAYNNLWISDGAGEYNGVMIFSYDLAETLNMGDEIVIAGKRDVYYDNTEIADGTVIELVSSGNDLVVPAVIMGSDIASDLPASAETAEKWEGQMVKIENATVISYDEENFIYTLSDDDEATTFLLGDNVVFQLEGLTLNIGSTYHITGVVDFSYDQYRINPRFQDDIVETNGIGIIQRSSVNIYPNPVTSVLNISNASDFSQITITDVTGKVCTATFTGGANEVSIDVNNLRSGVYFVNFINGEQTNQTLKIMVR